MSQTERHDPWKGKRAGQTNETKKQIRLKIKNENQRTNRTNRGINNNSTIL